jgi:hypothetical protein
MYIEWIRFIAILDRALADGAVIEPPVVRWDVSMDCANPYEVELTSEPDHGDICDYHKIASTSTKWRRMYILTPCRKCQRCLDNRTKLWAARAAYEVRRAPRTWFVTLTINPQSRFIFSCRAKNRNYHASYGEISKEVTKMFKRLRKAGYKFRYMMVAEAHRDGYPHIHLLIHEVSQPIPKREIERQWNYGFTKVKLVEDDGAARYVTKYLAKDMLSRVRASLHYGEEVAVCDLNFHLVRYNIP